MSKQDDLSVLARELLEAGGVLKHPVYERIRREVFAAGRNAQTKPADIDTLAKLHARLSTALGGIERSDLNHLPRPMLLLSLAMIMESAYGLGALAGSREAATAIAERLKDQQSTRGRKGAQGQVSRMTQWRTHATPILVARRGEVSGSDLNLANWLIAHNSDNRIKNLPTTPRLIVALIQELVDAGQMVAGKKDGRAKKVGK